ncbi:MAG: methyltransferase domain-containing protein [Dehalococcoidia bacterium]|nr:methyltransferase domain-containing protein [Dehalococcoidia bacterium]
MGESCTAQPRFALADHPFDRRRSPRYAPHMSDPTPEPPLTALEQRWHEVAPPVSLDSARAMYEWMPKQRGGQLPWVDVPYDPQREQHWSDAARVADYVAHIPVGARWVLDVGPGDGWPALPVAYARPEVVVVGLDSPRRVATCEANARRLGIPNARFVAGDADALPFGDAAFDAVLASYSLEEAAEPEAVLRELARVLRPGGALRAAYQDWRLPAPEVETVLLPDGERRGERVLLYSYVRRIADPALERRYILALPSEGPAASLHTDGLVAASAAPRAFGETLLEAGSPLGAPLLERLAPHALASMCVEMRRWTTAWLVEALHEAGFREARGTVHPGDLARRAGRELIAGATAEHLGGSFEAVAGALGRATGRLDGDAMVEAVR